MKKLICLFAAAALTLALATMADAAEAKKVKPRFITGTVEAVDAAAGTISVKGKVETISLKAGEKVKLDGIKVGDKVTATYSEGVASKIKVVAAKKPAAKEMPEKKEVAPAGNTAAPSGR